MDVSGFLLLDNIEDEDPDNHILSWADMTDPGSQVCPAKNVVVRERVLTGV